MAKWVCQVCGYVHEGDTAPESCPVCKAPASKFTKQDAEMTWAAEHVVGVASDAPEDIKEDLRANFNGECSEVGMYLAMSRVAFREGYPEIPRRGPHRQHQEEPGDESRSRERCHRRQDRSGQESEGSEPGCDS